MVKDPIIEELHDIRRQIAAEHGNDLQRIGAYFMEKQKQRANQPTAFPPRRPVGWIPATPAALNLHGQ